MGQAPQRPATPPSGAASTGDAPDAAACANVATAAPISTAHVRALSVVRTARDGSLLAAAAVAEDAMGGREAGGAGGGACQDMTPRDNGGDLTDLTADSSLLSPGTRAGRSNLAHEKNLALAREIETMRQRLQAMGMCGGAFGAQAPTPALSGAPSLAPSVQASPAKPRATRTFNKTQRQREAVPPAFSLANDSDGAKLAGAAAADASPSARGTGSSTARATSPAAAAPGADCDNVNGASGAQDDTSARSTLPEAEITGTLVEAALPAQAAAEATNNSPLSFAASPAASLEPEAAAYRAAPHGAQPQPQPQQRSLFEKMRAAGAVMAGQRADCGQASSGRAVYQALEDSAAPSLAGPLMLSHALRRCRRLPLLRPPPYLLHACLGNAVSMGSLQRRLAASYPCMSFLLHHHHRHHHLQRDTRSLTLQTLRGASAPEGSGRDQAQVARRCRGRADDPAAAAIGMRA